MKNFRGFKGEHVVPLAKLTLLYGPNSSGKSSVLHAMKLMANSLDDDFVNPLASLPFCRNNFLNGTFESNINDQDLEKEMGLGFSSTSLRSNGVRSPFTGEGMVLDCSMFYKHFSKIGAFENLDEHVVPHFFGKSHQAYWNGQYSNNLIQRLELKLNGPNGEYSMSLEDGKAPLRKHLGVGSMYSRNFTKWEKEVSRCIDDFDNGHDIIPLSFHLKCVPSFMKMVKGWLTYNHKEKMLDISEAMENDRKEEKFIAYHESLMKAFDRPEIIEILEHTTWRVDTNRGRVIRGEKNFFSVVFDVRDIIDLVPQEDETFLDALTSVLEFVNSLNSKFRELETSKYIGPIRAIPKRYAVVNDFPEQRGFYDRGAEFPYTGILPDEMNQVNKWLKILGIPYTLDINETGNEYTGPIVTPTVKHTKTGTKLTLAEVGFGISQILPILGCLSVMTQPIYIEQPEIHLHPKMQAGLADFFIERISQKFDYLGNEICEDKASCNNEESKGGLLNLFKGTFDPSPWVIETHSESLMLRLQRRIREGVISHEDISVVYIGYIEGEGSVVVPLRLNEEGEFIDEWPGGFFEENFDDVFGSELS